MNAFELFQSYKSEIETEIATMSFSNSLRCLFIKTKQINTIREDIERVRYTYTSQILLRSLIEHFLISFYVFVRLRKDQTDEVGLEYYDFYQNSEYLKQETYSIQIENIKDQKKEIIDANKLKSKLPHLKNLKQRDLEGYHYEGNKFANIKNIGKYLIENRSFEPKFEPMTSKLIDLLDLYSYLSSYVHGGPFAERELSGMNESEINDFHKKTVSWANTLSKISINTLFLSMSYENPNKYKPIFTRAYRNVY